MDRTTSSVASNLGAAGIGAVIGDVSAGITASGKGASPFTIVVAIGIGAGGGAFSGFVLNPLGSITVGGISGGAGNLISQTISSDKSVNLGNAGVAAFTGLGGGGASLLAKAGGFGTAVQAGFGASVTAVSQGLVDLRTAANNNYPASGMVSNNPNNISANNFGSAPASQLSRPRK